MTALLSSASIGMPAPDFELTDDAGRRITLAHLRGQPAILAFYPLTWNPAHTSQLAHFNSLVARVPGVSAELLGISTDGMWCHLAFSGDDEVRVPLLADLDPWGAIAAKYGVSGEHAVFVIDAHGVIRWKHVGAINVAHTTELVTALAALAPDTHGPVSLFDQKSAYPISMCAAAFEYACDQLTPSRRELITTALAAALMLSTSPLVAVAEPLAGKLTPVVAVR